VLIRHHIVFIFRIQWLVMGRNVNLIVGELVFAEILKEVSGPGGVEVDVRVRGVFGLCGLRC
jgi:hypothetical protein